jgi:hypothetical protein
MLWLLPTDLFLVHGFLDLELQNVPSCLLVLGLGFSSLFFSSFGFEHCHHISYFCGMLKPF